MSLFKTPGALVGSGSANALFQEGGDPPLLALHGWGGTPQEVALVVDQARKLGLRCHAPLLPGHGTTPSDLATRTFDDWAQAAVLALDRVSPTGQPAIVAGLSLGSVLALHLAITRPERVQALVLLANAVWLSAPMPAWALALADRFGAPDVYIPKSAGPDIADVQARQTHLTYDSQPVRSALEVWRAGRRVRGALANVRCPVFIAHGRRDRVCPVRNAHRVAARLSSVDKQVLVLPRSRHIVTRDLDREQLGEHVSRFIERQA